MSAKKARYCIGELSTLCNIPQKTLRYYDEIGLFTPDYRDDSTHYRYYSKSQIVNLMIIKTLKQMGFPLKDIRQIISENDAQSLEANINSHLETMRDDIMKRISTPNAAICSRRFKMELIFWKHPLLFLLKTLQSLLNIFLRSV